MAKREQIATYNALKGIGAIGILFSHMSYLKDAAHPFWKGVYQVFMSKGAVCTTLFMLCSGFFLDYAWKDQKFGKYVVGKLKRIYPLTFIVFIAAVVVDIFLSGNAVVNDGISLGSSKWFFNVIANLFLFKAFIPIEAVFYSFHGPSWYISALFAFYLFAYPILKKLHSSNEAIFKKYLIIIRGGVIFTYSLELLICILVRVFDWQSLWLCYVNPWFRIFGEGFAGILLCEEMDDIQRRLKNTNWAEWMAAVLFAVAFLARNLHLNIMSAWIQIIPMGFLLIAFRKGMGAVSRVLKTGVFQFIGTISFELYMSHAFVYEGLPIAIGVVSKDLQQWLILHAGTRFIITLILCIVVAWLVHIGMVWINKR